MRIHVRFKLEGWHHWKDAPERRAYLRNSHRHLFHFEVSCEVEHEDREIEFHDLMAESRQAVVNMQPKGDFGTRSCEKIARELGAVLALLHERDFTVTVWEDGECGATVESRRPRAENTGPSDE